MHSARLRNTVLGYKKGSKTKNIFWDFEKICFELSNALSNVLIRHLEPEIHLVDILTKMSIFSAGGELFSGMSQNGFGCLK